MRSGRRVAVDVGKVRVGLAVSDFHGILASPLPNVLRESELGSTMIKLLEAIEEFEPIEIYVGLPLSMSAQHTASTSDAVTFARALQLRTKTPVKLVDERLTSVSANAILRSSGKDGRQSRKLVDQVAATLILEQALDLERAGNAAPGIDIGEYLND